MSMNLKVTTVTAALLTVLISAPAVWAERTVSEKGRTVYHFAKTEVMQVGDVPGHIVGIVDARGLSFLENGEVATYSSKITFDLINGTGPHQTYGLTTFEDKSTITTLNKGTTTAREDGTSTFEGTLTYLGGTGRFAGIKGSGSYRGKRMAPVTPGVPSDAFSDYVATYTLPPQ